MRCPRCGAHNDDGWNVCYKCGNILADASPQRPVPNQRPHHSPSGDHNNPACGQQHSPAGNSQTPAYHKSSVIEEKKTFPAESAVNVEVSKATTAPGKNPETDAVREISETRATETWYCPNDETANTGSTCVICGCSRPVPVLQASPANTQQAPDNDVQRVIDQIRNSPKQKKTPSQRDAERRPFYWLFAGSFLGFAGMFVSLRLLYEIIVKKPEIDGPMIFYIVFALILSLFFLRQAFRAIRFLYQEKKGKG